MELITYLLKVSACTVLFFAFYLLVLRKLTFFKSNRFYLLVTLALSFIIPALNFTIEREVEADPVGDVNLMRPFEQEVVSAMPLPRAIEETLVVQQPFDWLLLLPYLYLFVVVVILFLACWRILQLLRYTKKGATKVNGLRVVAKTGGFTNCSFFNFVFIDENSLTAVELEVLLRHEQVHAKQFHSADKLLLMLIKAVLWFNPVVYLYDKALEQAHEYEADEATSKTFGTEPYANLLLRLAISKSEMPLVHNFVKSPIRERIKMLFNSKSKHMKKLVYLLAIPIGLGLLWGFTVEVVEVSKGAENEATPFTLVLDAGHGGKDNGAKVDGISEKNITLTMAKKIKVLAEAKEINVVTTRNADENVSIKDRAKATGDILISLHVNSEPTANGGKRNGIELLTSGGYSDDNLKLPKSNNIIYYLYNELNKITGIKVINQPIYSNVLLLHESPLPGVILELGYLTNKNDLGFLTNEIKQDQLAKLIVEGVLMYKEKLPASEELRLKFKKSHDDFEVKYAAWKNSKKYTELTNETKNFKAQTLTGKIQSLNYVKFAGIPTLDGFILNANGKLYRIFIGREKVKSLKFKVNDEVKLFAPKAEVWFDSDYPAIHPQKLTILESLVIIPKKIVPKLTSASNIPNLKSYDIENLYKPILIRSTSITVDAKADIIYLKNGFIKIGDRHLEAEKITFDRRNRTITAKNGVIKGKDNLYFLAKDSIKIDKANQVVNLYGKAEISLGDVFYKGAKILYNSKLNTIKVVDASFMEKQTNKIYRADSLFINLSSSKAVAFGLEKN